MRKVILTIIAAVMAVMVFGEEKTKVNQLNPAPSGWDIQGFQFCYHTTNQVLNMRSKVICKPGITKGVRVSPAKFSVAVLHSKGKKDAISIYSMVNGYRLHTFSFSNKVTVYSFTPNARNLVVVTGKTVNQYSTIDYREIEKGWNVQVVPEHLALSANGYYLTVARNEEVYVYNFENHKLRKSIKMGAKVTHVTFSADSRYMGVMQVSGTMKIYDTKRFEEIQDVKKLGKAINFEFHPDGKYITAVTKDDQLSILNLKEPDEIVIIETENAGIDHISYSRSEIGDLYVAYNTASEIIFRTINELKPDYYRICNDFATEQMTEWVKQMPDETEEAYGARLEPQQRNKQQTRFTNAKATELAGTPIMNTKTTVGGYNEADQILILHLSDMKDIRLNVPTLDAENFSGDLHYDNVTYCVDEKDHFHVYEADIVDLKSGKSYHYIRDDMSVPTNEKLVPLDVLKRTNEEQRRLEQLKREIMSQAMDSNLISDHTHINVRTSVETTNDAEGDDILNYIIDFNYNVDSGYVHEDFEPGKYSYAESNAASAMLQVINRAFKEQFSRYLQKGKKVVVDVYGSADAAPVNRVLPYNGEYGDFNNELVYSNNELSAINVTQESGITSNGQLSFMRAAGVRDYVEKNIPEIGEMQNEYLYHLTTSTEVGNQYRRIGVRFIFIDVFR